VDEAPAIEVRPIEPEEYELAAELLKGNIGEYDSYDFDTDISDVAPERIDTLYDEPKGKFWIAAAEDSVVGTVALARRDDRLCQFKRLSVHPDYRRHDVPRQLILAAEEYARENGYRRAVVEITTRQKPAQVFFQSGGYQEVKRTLRGKMVVITYEKTL
jgi:N-acetylglutamate synthase-like GNAT family acetyltransferase